jgi:competence protein ComGC
MGYTLCELLVILAVNGLLLCMLVPTVNRVRRAAADGWKAKQTALKARAEAAYSNASRVAQPGLRQPILPVQVREPSEDEAGAAGQRVDYNHPGEF